MFDEAIEDKEERFTQKKNLTTKVLPEFQQMFTDLKELSSNLQISYSYRIKRQVQLARKKYRDEKS